MVCSECRPSIEGRVGKLRAETVVALDVPHMRTLFDRGDAGLEQARKAQGKEFRLSEVSLKAPIIPKKFFHTAGNFREHAQEGDRSNWVAQILRCPPQRQRTVGGAAMSASTQMEGLHVYSTLTIQKEAGIATLTLNLPQRRNAMTPAMAQEFPQAVAELGADPDLKVVILTGAGTTFCAGGDLDALYDQTGWTPEQNRIYMGQFYRAFLSVMDLPVPTIAAINGAAVGAGFCMALGCDLRYAAQGAKMGTTYINIGLHPGMGATHLVPYYAGHAVAAELLLTGRLLTAEEAAPLGLINRAVPGEQLMDYAGGVAREIAAKSPSAVRGIKQILQRRMAEGLERAMDIEALAQTISFSSEEMRSILVKLRQQRQA